MRNYVKSTKHILRLFDKECAELCYTDYIPNEVDKARAKLKASMEKGPVKMENVKEQLMHSLRDAFDPDKYDLSLASFLENGEKAV